MEMTMEIKDRHTGEVLCTGETVRAACEANRANLYWANLRGADLRHADLRRAILSRADLRHANLSEADLEGADLDGADLRHANLSEADLEGAALYLADLRNADLRGADLRGAYLAWANLDGADLSGADLRGAELGEADLRGALLSWRSHDLIAEILRREAGGDVEKLKVAGLVLAARDMCWQDFLAIEDPLTGWALSVLKEYVVPGDDAPEVVRSAERSDSESTITAE